ncbi:MAG: triphosphoribosyl-dephospho-CoA synthase, partial [Bacteroidales bacterium]|nr:triphosphoribosyl-dephospho-CoA synthase [Bacteroidales bacterium]
LNTPGKPGLVGPDGSGAHKDMDYDTMLRGIKALRPFWSRMAMASGPDKLRELGIEAEKAMLSATGGVNTHRGAIFCLGIALNAAEAWRQQTDIQQIMQKRVKEIAHPLLHNQLKNNNLAPRREGVKDARAMALDGYSDLFTDWLPFYREAEQDALQKTLLRIISTLDDTCVIKRVGYDRAQEVKREANASPTLADAIEDMCIRYAQEGISPGGAADMLALTIFFDSII